MGVILINLEAIVQLACTVVTLRVYAQQGYAFGCISLCLCIYVYMWPKNWLFEVLPLENLLLVQTTACLSSLTAEKEAYCAR